MKTVSGASIRRSLARNAARSGFALSALSSLLKPRGNEMVSTRTTLRPLSPDPVPEASERAERPDFFTVVFAVSSEAQRDALKAALFTETPFGRMTGAAVGDRLSEVE
jgi:hypothetical protein